MGVGAGAPNFRRRPCRNDGTPADAHVGPARALAVSSGAPARGSGPPGRPSPVLKLRRAQTRPRNMVLRLRGGTLEWNSNLKLKGLAGGKATALKRKSTTKNLHHGQVRALSHPHRPPPKSRVTLTEAPALPPPTPPFFLPTPLNNKRPALRHCLTPTTAWRTRR